MKFKLDTKSLAEAFQTVSAAVPSRSPKPILQSVKAVCGSDLVLTATDGDIGIRLVIEDVDCESPGECLLPSIVGQIIKTVSGDSVTVEATKAGVVIESGGSRFDLQTEDSAEFPALSGGSGDALSFDPVLFRQALRRTVFATDPESTRYALAGVRIEFTDDECHIVATDSRRLAVQRLASKSSAASCPIIPTKAAKLLLSAFDDANTPLMISVKTNDAIFSSGSTTVYTRLVEGRYPRWQDVIPKTDGTQIDIICGPIISAIRQVAITTSDESRGVVFRFSSGLLTLESGVSDRGESHVEVPLSCHLDEPITVTLDPRFVLDGLNAIGADHAATFVIIDNESPVVIRTTSNYTYLVMPLETNK